MSNLKTLSLLAVATALAVTAAVWTTRPAPQQASLTVNTVLLPTLAQQPEQVKALKIVTAGDSTAVELAATADGWVVVNKHRYPAAVAQVQQLLLTLANAQVLEEKTANPEFYARLGVEPVSEPAAGGVRLELAGLAEPLALIVGKPGSSGMGTYVRRADAAQSLLVAGTLTVASNPLDWLERSVLDLPAERVQQVTIRQPDGTLLSLRKDEAGEENYTLVDVPAGREPASPFAVDQVAGALAGLQLDDVFPAAEVTLPAATVSAEFRTFDGLVITATAFQQDGRDYVKLTAAYAGEADDAPVQTQAQRLQARLADWVYVLPSYQYGPLTRSLEDVLKPLAEPEAAAGE